MKDQPLIFWLVVWNIFYHFLFFHILGIIIIPTDELTPSFFRGVFVKPPTSFSIGNSGVSSQDMVLELALLVDAEISWQFEPVGGLGLFVAFMHQISHLGRWKFSNSCRTPQKIEEVDFFFRNSSHGTAKMLSGSFCWHGNIWVQCELLGSWIS